IDSKTTMRVNKKEIAPRNANLLKSLNQKKLSNHFSKSSEIAGKGAVNFTLSRFAIRALVRKLKFLKTNLYAPRASQA
ncbi:MAG: hypothetical protein ACREFR_05215, partial [Limisphaerales bacterium]